MEKYLEILMDVATGLGVEIVEANLINNDKLELSIGRLDYAPVDLETVSLAANAFAEALDFNLELDVGSAGAEREIESDMFHTLEGQYVLVKFTNPMLGADYVEGTVKSVDDEAVHVEYRQMHALKTIEIPQDNIAYLRLAVKV